MSFLLRHIQEIILTYKGHPPLTLFLKNYFKHYPKLGSRDRKAITEACFLYYRAANFYPQNDHLLSIIAKAIQWNGTQNVFLKKTLETVYPPEAKCTPPDFSLARKGIKLSDGITENEWLSAQWQQPDLFIRLIGNIEKNLEILEQEAIPFHRMPATDNDIKPCLSLPNGSKVDNLFAPQDYIIQDYASQMAAAIATKYRNNSSETQLVWDVCAGAGGKSLYWKTAYPQDFILATDIRKSILYNLKQRFQLYGFNRLKTKVMDISQKKQTDNVSASFNHILCDVPCSGSGTWSRTPEQFYFFRKEMISDFPPLQFRIALAASQKLKKGGTLAYITCSVFEEENEMVIEKLLSHNRYLRLKQMQLINGIAQKADCLFVAILQQDS